MNYPNIISIYICIIYIWMPSNIYLITEELCNLRQKENHHKFHRFKLPHLLFPHNPDCYNQNDIQKHRSDATDQHILPLPLHFVIFATISFLIIMPLFTAFYVDFPHICATKKFLEKNLFFFAKTIDFFKL